MGTQFFWFFDIVIVVLAFVFIFKGIKRGFVAEIAALVSLVVAFAVSLPLSGTLANAIYESVIKDAVSDEINNQIGSVLENSVIEKLQNLDMSSAKVNNRDLSELVSKPDSAGKISVDLSNLDLSGTGLKNIDLEAFGIDSKTFDYSAVNLGTVVMSADDVNNYGLETMVLSTLLSDNMVNGTAYGSICGAVEEMAESVPFLMEGVSESVTSGDRTIIQDIVLSVLDTKSEDFAKSITDNMIKPILLVPVRALIFVILFIIINIVLCLIVKMLKGVNKIPLVGGVNKLLGAVAGAVEGIIVIFLVCIFINVVINLTDNGLIFLNTMTIDETMIFKKIYYFEFLDFLA